MYCCGELEVEIYIVVEPVPACVILQNI